MHQDSMGNILHDVGADEGVSIGSSGQYENLKTA
jgi:hypothetical protein